MTGPLIYPGADRTTQWVGKGSVTMLMDHVKWVVHTTETPSWPSYDYDGVHMGSAPTLTYNPSTHSWRQHFEINQSARALRNDGTFYCNRADVVQTEIVCYCDHALAAKYGHACTDLDAQAINDLGDFGAWLVTEWGMDLAFYPDAVPWPRYPAGTTRMTTTKYATWSGVLGHMAVPGNTHLDPGDLPMDKVKARMLQQAEPWPAFRDTSPVVGQMVTKLSLAGYFPGKRRDRANYYGYYTREAVKALQEAQGWSGAAADGLLGPQTWALIQALPDAPPPPHGKPLAEEWLRATHAASMAGAAFLAAHPKMPKFGLLRAAQVEQAAALRKLTQQGA